MPKGVKMEKYRPKIHFSAEDYIINYICLFDYLFISS